MLVIGSLALSFIPGGYEWLVILFVALLLFGSRLPSLMRSLGGSVREFKQGMDGKVDSDEKADKDGRPSDGEAAAADDKTS